MYNLNKQLFFRLLLRRPDGLLDWHNNILQSSRTNQYVKDNMHRQYSLYGSFQNLSSALDLSNNDSPNLSLQRHFNSATPIEEIAYTATSASNGTSNLLYHPQTYGISRVQNGDNENLYRVESESPRVNDRHRNEYDTHIKSSIPRFLMSPQRESPPRTMDTKSPLRLNSKMFH